VTLKDFGQRPINGASILVDRTRSKQLHTSQNVPSFCAFYWWVTTFSSAKRVSGWLRERNLGGVTGELRRLGLRVRFNMNIIYLRPGVRVRLPPLLSQHGMFMFMTMFYVY